MLIKSFVAVFCLSGLYKAIFCEDRERSENKSNATSLRQPLTILHVVQMGVDAKILNFSLLFHLLLINQIFSEGLTECEFHPSWSHGR